MFVNTKQKEDPPPLLSLSIHIQHADVRLRPLHRSSLHFPISPSPTTHHSLFFFSPFFFHAGSFSSVCVFFLLLSFTKCDAGYEKEKKRPSGASQEVRYYAADGLSSPRNVEAAPDDPPNPRRPPRWLSRNTPSVSSIWERNILDGKHFM